MRNKIIENRCRDLITSNLKDDGFKPRNAFRDAAGVVIGGVWQKIESDVLCIVRLSQFTPEVLRSYYNFREKNILQEVIDETRQLISPGEDDIKIYELSRSELRCAPGLNIVTQLLPPLKAEEPILTVH